MGRRRKLGSVLRWIGGKGHIAEWVASKMPPCKVYVEVFGGGANVLLARKPVPLEVYNDVDKGLADFFTVVSSPVLFEEFRSRCASLPISRTLYFRFLRSWRTDRCLVRRVAKWFYVARVSFGGRFGASFGFGVRSTTTMPASWLSAIDMLPEFHQRLLSVQIECLDWKKVLEYYDSEEALFYCDPPYVLDTRRAGAVYENEMTDKDHKELIRRLLDLKGLAVVSGYDHPIYRKLDEAGWTRYEKEVDASSAGKTRATGLKGTGGMKEQRRLEVLWVSPNRFQRAAKQLV